MNIQRELDDHDPSEWGNVQLPGMTDEKLHSTNWNHVTAARIRAQDPIWKENQAKAQINRSQNSTWINKKQEAHQRLENDPEFIAKRQQGINKRSNNIEWRKNQLEGAKRNAVENIEWLQNKNKSTRRSLAKPCITPLGIFATGAEAGVAYNKERGVTNGKNAVCGALKKGKPGYRYISKEEYTRLTGKEI